MVKKENFNIESSELETGWALRKLFILLLDTAIKMFQFYIIRELEEGETPVSISNFNEQELTCLATMGTMLEGKTLKQQNPYKKNSPHWVIWILARLGGWKGYASQRKPGLTTILHGMELFYTHYRFWGVKDWVNLCVHDSPEEARGYILNHIDMMIRDFKNKTAYNHK